MKRLGIFVFYDKDGIVGKYVEYLLTEIKSVVDDLYIVSNSILTAMSKEIFLSYTNNIIERKNKGFDGGAYKDILCNVIGFDNCKQWDELLLVNDTFYGPFCSLFSIFHKMESSACDFWGLSIHGDKKVNDYYIIHRHIQSYFLVVRSNLFHSARFSKFWLDMETAESMRSVIDNFEIVFTQFFTEYGYTHDVFADTTYCEKNYLENGDNWTDLFPYDLLIQYKFPLVKRKALVSHNSFQTEALKILHYINDNTDYDIQMIWQDLLRRYNIYELIFKMNLIYIIDSKNNQNISVYDIARIVIIFRIDTSTKLEDAIPYIDEIGKSIKVYVWIENIELLQLVQKRCKSIEICYCKNKKESLLFWKSISEKFDYIGYIYLKSSSKDSYFSNYIMTNNIQENLIKNIQYIYKIGSLMMKEKAIGLLLPPLNRYSNYDYNWGGDAFWIKGICLKELCKYKKIQCLPEQVQRLGFYSAIVESDAYARTEVLRFNQMIFEEKKSSFFQTSQKRFQDFWFQYTKRYIYGIGKIAEEVTNFLCQKGWDQYEGYVVTKKGNEDLLFYGKKVWQFDEVPENEMGIIIAMNEQNTREVLPLLNNRKGIHCFILSGMEL